MSMEKVLKQLKVYSPARMLIGMLANQTANRRYRQAMQVRSVAKQAHAGLRENHILVSDDLVGTAEMLALRADVEALFSAQTALDDYVSVVKGRYVPGVHPAAEALYLGENTIPYDALLGLVYRSSLFATLQAMHGCEFYCRTAAVFKTTARDDIPEGSFRFHRDGHPHCSYKILLYITDVDSLSAGPTSFIPGSAKPLIPGYGAYRVDRPTDRDVYEQHAVIGKSGTALLFNTNGLHAGGRTVKGERIIATLQLMPKFDVAIDEFSACKSYRFGQLEYDII